MALRLFLGVFLVIGSNLLQLTSTGSAHAAGFNCQSARSPLEKRICDDATLSRADELLAHVYRAQLAATPMELRQRLRESQRSWLAYIGPYCSIPADHRRQCLRDGFADRTKELGATMRKVGGKSFFQTWAYAVAFDQDRPDRAFAQENRGTL